MEAHDIAIIGAGPAGLHLAKVLKGLDVLVLEDDPAIGKPIQCSGLYSTNLERFVSIDKHIIEHTVCGAVLHAPDGTELILEKQGIAAYVVDRGKLEQLLSQGLGAEIRTNTRAESIAVHKNGVEVRTKQGLITANLVAGCDGPNSVVAKTFGVKPKEIITGLIAIVPEENYNQRVELWFDRDQLTDGFFWKIPRGKTTEYGIFASTATYKQLEAFFSLKQGYEKRAGAIPLGPPKTYFPRALLIGDAAAQVKPWSCGGVIYGMTCGDIAARVIKQAFEKQDFSEQFLRQYEEQWKKAIGMQITAGMAFRDAYRLMDNTMVSRLFAQLRTAAELNQLDMDFIQPI